MGLSRRKKRHPGYLNGQAKHKPGFTDATQKMRAWEETREGALEEERERDTRENEREREREREREKKKERV